MHRRLLASAVLAAALTLPPAAASAADPPASLTLEGTARDFRGYDLPAGQGLPRGHVDFENANGFETGIVRATLGPDRTPRYNKGELGAGSATTHGRAAFEQWFADTPDVNLAEPIALPFARQPSGRYVYDAAGRFFPLDGSGWVRAGREPTRTGSDGLPHNFSFTVELHSEMLFTGSETITVTGDDDIWIFVNGRLAVDLGGVHGPASGTVDLAQQATSLGLVRGALHDVDVFVAERKTSGSTLKIDTSRLGFDAGGATLPPSATLGETLSCAVAGWPADVALSYAWLRDGIPVDGATGATYAVADGDVGAAIACRVTGTRRTTASTTSAAAQITGGAGPVDPGGPPVTPPGGPGPGPSLPAPLPPPSVTVTEAPASLTRSRSVRVAFAADPAAASHECRLDDGPWARCSSPHELTGLRAGGHRIEIRAVTADGRRGESAVRGFQVNPYAPGVRLLGRTLRTGAGGAVALRIACSEREGDGSGACEGTVRLQRTTGSGTRARTVVLGRAAFAAGAGRTADASVRLTPAARRLLAGARGPLPVRVVLDARDLAGNRGTVSFARTLRG